MIATLNYYQHMAKEAKAAKAVIAASGNINSGKKEGSASAKVNLVQPNVTLKNAMVSLVTDRQLHKGIAAMRITSRGVWKQRVLTISQDKLAFFVTHREVPSNLSSTLASSLSIPLWTPSKGLQWSNDNHRYIRHLDIADIDAWQVGVIGTQILEYAKHSIKENQISELVTLFHHGFKPMCFRIPNTHHRNAFVNALPLMKNRYNLLVSFIAREQLLLRYISYDIDVDENGLISSKEFAELCKRINLSLPNRNQLFSDFAKKSTSSKNPREISRTETRQLLHSISLRDMPASEVWDHVFGKDTQSVGPGQLREDFLLSVQKEKATTLEDTELLIQSIKTMGYTTDDDKRLYKQEFSEFLTSKFNDAYDPAARLPLESKLDQPLSHYWINTSHNTYLTGDQIQSRSSVVAYVDALFRGCKCLELDCWDGYEDKKRKEFVPVVFHGHTMTSKIEFESILHVVANYLKDNPTTYPIILSLENHCSIPYQRTMALKLKKVFGRKLYIPKKQQLVAGHHLPSPEELRGMVVIKGKRPPDEEDQVIIKEGEQVPHIESAESMDDNGIDEYDEALKKGKKSKIDPELAMLTLFHGCKYKDFSVSIQQPSSHMHSIGESKISKILDKSPENAKKWREYNTQHLTRTYPAGSRIDSSNYNPVVAWATGCQLVALNFQTSDTPLFLNDARFRQGGGMGYLLKPDSVLGRTHPTKINITVEILSALCIPKPKGLKAGEVVDPYISVELYDVATSKDGKEGFSSQVYKTSTMDNNGFCPVWKKICFNFNVANADVAMLLFKIVDDDYNLDDIICSSAVPISCLRKGYRSVQLYDDHGRTSGPFECATLFVKIEYHLHNC
ncbi:phosphatidylinositol-specific phospholipase C, X domain containing protein [Nitzschia inconspicua]|uniref:phosphoinositide phospholipase C n=1 Tax=Nitzschia inconspicua TaxID=303405 RepID=A0A9K3LSL4_9STRA|nr:phosphatidylinositol-specific phospholipase C, X domain containing protein [Nitzschia inconspicua]